MRQQQLKKWIFVFIGILTILSAFSGILVASGHLFHANEWGYCDGYFADHIEFDFDHSPSKTYAYGPYNLEVETPIYYPYWSISSHSETSSHLWIGGYYVLRVVGTVYAEYNLFWLHEEYRLTLTIDAYGYGGVYSSDSCVHLT